MNPKKTSWEKKLEELEAEANQLVREAEIACAKIETLAWVAKQLTKG